MRTAQEWAPAAATAAMIASSGVAALAGARAGTVVIFALLAFVPYALLVAAPRQLERARAVRAAVLLALVAGVVLVVAPPVLSDDLFRYLWDGRVISHGISPYRYAPADPALAHLRDGAWSRINNAEIATIYPPLAQAVFAIADQVWHHVASLKVLALGAHLATIPVVARLAGDRGGDAALVYGLNPLVLVESALSGHVDVVAGLAIAAAALALLSQRPGRAALFVAAAAGVKLIGIALAPLVALRDRRAAVLAIALCAAALAPLLLAGGSPDGAGITHYTRRWRGNEGAFGLLDRAARAALAAAADEDDAPGQIRLAALGPLIASLRGSPADVRATLTAEKKATPDPADFQIAFLASQIARGLALLLVLGLAVFLALRRTDPLTAFRVVLLAALLLAPQIHPWYLLWLLPIEAACGGRAGIVWSAAILVAYAPLDQWLIAREWAEQPVARVLQHALIVGVLTAEVVARVRFGKNGPATAVHVGRETG